MSKKQWVELIVYAGKGVVITILGSFLVIGVFLAVWSIVDQVTK